MSSDRAEPRRGYLSRVDGRQLTIAKIISSIAVIFLIVGFVFQEETNATATPGEIVTPVAATEGVAISGYDPVAYFTDGGPEWWFETEENRTTFLSAPDRFAPQFGGFALESVANGNGFAGNPEVFKILEGRLYLSRSPKSQSLWLRNPDGYIRAAEQAWAASCPVVAKEQTRSVKTEMVIPYC